MSYIYKNVEYRGIDNRTNEVIFGTYSPLITNIKSEIPNIRDCNGTDHPIYINSLSPYSGVNDISGKKLYLKDKVSFLKYEGVVVFENGAFGIGFNNILDWNRVKKASMSATGNKLPQFCECDNFISFYEICWNFNCLNSDVYVIKLIKSNYVL